MSHIPDKETVTISGWKIIGRRRGLMLAGLVIIVAGLVATAWWRTDAQSHSGHPMPSTITPQSAAQPQAIEIQIPADQLQRVNLKYATVTEEMINQSMPATTGTVQSNQYRDIKVLSQVGGRVTKVNVQLGTRVKTGQVIASVFSNELAEAQTAYIKATIEEETLRLRYERTQKLVEIGGAAKQESETDFANLHHMETERESMRQKLYLLGLTEAQVNGMLQHSHVSSELNITAPIDGEITGRTINPGLVIMPQAELFSISDLSTVWVIANVYERDLGSVRIGSGAMVTTQAYGERAWHGKITYIDPRIEPQARTAQLRIEIANTDRSLKLGMYTQVSINAAASHSALMVPKAAVQNINGKSFVYVKIEDERFEQRPIMLGEAIGESYQVLGGLKVGEKIVSEGSFFLRAESLRLNPQQQ